MHCHVPPQSSTFQSNPILLHLGIILHLVQPSAVLHLMQSKSLTNMDKIAKFHMDVPKKQNQIPPKLSQVTWGSSDIKFQFGIISILTE